MEFLQDLQDLQDLGILDTVKNASYLFLGMLTGYFFWDFCERFAKLGISHINPFLYIPMVVWGASGFFFFSYSEFLISQLTYYAVPDWDIPLTIWAQREFLQHRSWFFSSVLIPLILLGISKLFINKITQKPKSKMINQIFKLFLIFLRDISIGLSIGICAHLMGDLLLQWIPSLDTSINIFGQTSSFSIIWLCLNLIFGFTVPFLVIHQTN